ncbi:MAG: 2-dehydro-3-deoxy-6-phosphogalactonate aldolase [Lentisphaerae bacterium]|nr:2-dehydro-3-deoxy-6-phosphogalactonate aldolase [Lentisphaerota bacterium]
MMDNSTLATSFSEKLKACPVIAILRGITIDEIIPVCSVLAENGITLLEIPLNTPDALKCIEFACKNAPSGQIIGAGTVLSAEDVQNVYDHGGKFIISPNMDTAVVRRTKELGMLSIPGCFTATECFSAVAAGADYLKLFPAGSVGPGYIKDLKAVVKKPFLAVGGVNSENIGGFIKECAGTGIGGSLYRPGKTPDAISSDCRILIEKIKYTD